ncbi:unnamed protein product [Auanema sp. JU1783]|nr:unnamed protein product [Auanema sp. JU1783]
MMVLKVSFFILIFIYAPCSARNRLESAVNVKEAEKLLGSPIKIKTTEKAGQDLHNHWSAQAVSALIAAVANEKIDSVPQRIAKNHEKCSKNAQNVQQHAKCVQKLLELQKQYASAKFIKLKKGWKLRRNKKASRDREYMGSFRLRRFKREVIRKSSYELNSQAQQSPISIIAKQITNGIRNLKNKKEQRSWKEVLESVRKEGKKLKSSKKLQNMLKPSFDKKTSKTKYLNMKDIDVLERRRHSKRRPLADEIALESESAENADEVVDFTEGGALASKIMRGKAARTGSAKNEVVMEQVDLLRQGVKIGLNLFGRNTTGYNDKNVKFISPRFLSVVPEDSTNSSVDVLSPSLFSLHNEGEGVEKLTSLSTLLGSLGSKDRDSVMDMITEVAGVGEALENAEKQVKQRSDEDDGVLINSDGKEVHLSREEVIKVYGAEGYKTLKTFQSLNRNYSAEQIRQFKEYGYAQMSDKQLNIVYGKGGVYENPHLLKESQNQTLPDVRKKLYRTINQLAAGEVEIMPESRRMRDYVLSPFLFASIIGDPGAASQGIILSPVLFTVLLRSPAIFSSVILSPWVFVPVLVSPRLLSPVILSPFLFSPIILSPLALIPVILSPGLVDPFVLSPFVLCPIILSPMVLVPIILSPYALSPTILSPFTLSPLVLSPFVLSPSIYSPPSYTAVILSPYALSPSIESAPTNITVFASPSFLS